MPELRRNFAKAVPMARGGRVDDMSWLFDGYADGGRFREQIDPKGADLQFYDYDPKPIQAPGSPDPVVVEPATAASAAPYTPPSFVPVIDMSGGMGGSGIGGTQSTGAVGVSPSSVAGTGIGSIAANIGLGSTEGMIAALMSMAGMVSPAVGVIGGIASLANSLGLTGQNNGIAISNDQSTNNVAVDNANIGAAIAAAGLGPSQGPSAEGDQGGGGGAPDSGVGNPGDVGAVSGSDYARGGRIRLAHGGRAHDYNRFIPGGRF